MRCSPNGPHRACAIPMTTTHVWTANRRRRTAAATCAPPDNATTTHLKRCAARCWRRDSWAAQRPARHHGRVHDAHRARIGQRSCRHRRRHPVTDVRRDPAGHPRPTTTWSCSTTTPKNRSTSAAANGWHRPGSGLCCTPGIAVHPPRLHRARTTVSGPPRRRGWAGGGKPPISMKRHWPAPRQPPRRRRRLDHT